MRYRGIAATAKEANVAEIRGILATASREEFEAICEGLAADIRRGVQSALRAAEKRIAAEDAEAARIESLYRGQRERSCGANIVMGLDEVGRGPVAGPLTVAAVILPDEPRIQGLNDSKKIDESKRDAIAESIKETATAWAIVDIQPATIEEIGMAAALRKAFSEAIRTLEQRSGIRADAVLIDGNPLHIDPREITVVKGDATCACISAASIIAKCHRDQHMRELAQRYPGYQWEQNKGYASEAHIEAIRKLGLTPEHRRSFCVNFFQQTIF